MPVSPAYRPAPRITGLGDGFFDEVSAARFPRHELRFRNQRGAERIGLGDLDPPSGRLISRGSSRSRRISRTRWRCATTATSSTCTTRTLGDGRGFLFAQLATTPGDLLDLGTKGSGKTPWSRGATDD